MLGLFRSRRSLRALGSHISKVKTGPEPETIRLQHVKIGRKLFKPWHFFGACMAYYIAYNIYTTTTGGLLNKLLEKQFASMSPNERKQLKKELEESEDEPFTIPLPLTTQLVQPPPYKGSDPEWQMFIKIAKDQEEMARIRKTLAESARTAIMNHPQLKRLGRDLTVRRYWLDFHFPFRPPPTFERRVIEFGDEGIAIATEEIDSTLALRLKNILWPKALTLSTWTFTTELCKQNFKSVTSYFGLEAQSKSTATNVPPTLDTPLEKIRKQLAKAQPKAPDAKEQSPMASPKTQSVDGSETGSSTSMPPPSAPASSPPSSTTSPDASGPGPKAGDVADPTKSPRRARDVYGVRQMTDHTSGPWQSFKKKFGQSWRPAGNFPPRGSIAVSGMVEIVSQSSIMTVEVTAYWDPQEKKFDPRTITMKLKPIRFRSQAPMP